MSRLPPSTIKNILHFLKYRWWLVGVMALTIILNETVEHRWLAEQHVKINDYWHEVIQFGIILPLAEGTILTLADRAAEKSLQTAIQNERKNMAREIHDTLGQNLSYLHIKLQDLAATGTCEPETMRDLKKAQKAAEEAYRHIRGTLVNLDKVYSADIAAELLEQARMLGQRANFVVDFSSKGLPSNLPLNTQLTILYVFREALINVEKHAGARKVHLQAVWSIKELTFHLSDDGQGFITEAALPEGHFGLKIMRDRAKEINAQYTLVSHPGIGTKVTLQVPITHV